MRKDEGGSILIEFVGSFLLFVLLIMSILSLINIVTVQSRMHFALTQTANMLSKYGYVLHVTGLDERFMSVDATRADVNADIGRVRADIEQVFTGISDLGATFGGVQNTVNQAEGWIEGFADNPAGAIQVLTQYAMGELGGAGFELMLRGLVTHYLRNGEMSGAEYLLSVGITEPLQFYAFSLGSSDGNSVLLDRNGNVRITVQYYIDYSFMGLRLPFEPRLRVTQSVMTKMWLGGSGTGYSGK